MMKSKYFLYSFKQKINKKYTYWYETDKKYFHAKKPPDFILHQNQKEINHIVKNDIIKNPWLKWDSENLQEIITKEGVCLNYLKTSDGDFVHKQEDLKLLETYSYLVEYLDITESFGFETIENWHKEIFEDIYPFAGEIRTVNMSKGNDIEAWTWRLEFLKGLPDLDKFLKEITSRKYFDINEITLDLAKLTSDFLFIHPFREGNGRISRLITDIILAKNGFPMIGLNLKKNDKYLDKVHAGYQCDYEPMQELLKMKLLDIMN